MSFPQCRFITWQLCHISSCIPGVANRSWSIAKSQLVDCDRLCIELTRYLKITLYNQYSRPAVIRVVAAVFTVSDWASLLQPYLAYKMSASKRRKIYYFNEKWELDYFFIMINVNCTCLIWNASLALSEKGNLERHFMTRHAKHNDYYPLGSEARKRKVNNLKSNLHGQERVLKNFCTSSIALL